MSSLTFTGAFGRYGAKLRNVNWAVSGEAPDGGIVISCWAHYFKKAEGGVLPYVDSLSRWKGVNMPGNNLLREHLELAFREKRPVYLVVATTDDPRAVDAGGDASKLNNTFSVREDLVGTIAEWDGDRFVIEFRKRIG